MGSWGPGPLENDDALDWLSSLNATEGWPEINEILKRSAATASSLSDCTILVAACELVAIGAGHQEVAIPQNVVTWLKQVGAPPVEIRNTASDAIANVLKKSALKDEWKDGEEFSEWQTAIKSLKTRLKKMPTVSQVAVPLSPAYEKSILGPLINKYIALKNWEKAAEACRKLLETEVTRVVTRNNLAWCLAQCEKFSEAKAEIDVTFSYLESQKDLTQEQRAACFGTRAYIKLKTQDFAGSLEDYDTALSLHQRAINFQYRAEAHSALGHTQLAEKDLSAAKSLLVDEAIKKALRFWNDCKYNDCLHALNSALEIDQTHKLALIRRAMTLFELKNLEAAEVDLSRLIELYGDDANIFFERAQVLAQMNEQILARRDRERCHALGFDTIAFYHYRIEQIRSRVNTVAESFADKALLKELNLIISLVPENIEARLLRLQMMEAAGQTAKVVKERKELAKIQPLPAVLEGNLEKQWSKWFWETMTSK